MDVEILAFFQRDPAALELFEALLEALRVRYPRLEVQPKRTQINLRDGCIFACASLPPRRRAADSAIKLMLTLCLRSRLDSPRAFQSVEPHPGRWTHHFLLRTADDLDAEMLEWIDDAHEYAVERSVRR